jgi:hypothetical protein
MMGSWNGVHQAFAVKAYYVSVQHVFRNHFRIPLNDLVPSDHAIKTWIKNFKETCCTLKKGIGSVKSMRTPENVAIVEGAVQRSPTRSTHWHSVSLAFLIAV